MTQRETPTSLRSLPAKGVALRSEVAAAQRRGMRAPEGATAQTKNNYAARSGATTARDPERSEAKRSEGKGSEAENHGEPIEPDRFTSGVTNEFGVPARKSAIF